VVLQRLGDDRPALAVDLEDFACAVERRGELFALLRIGRKPRDQALDLFEQRIAASIQRRPIECRIAVETFEAVAREHGTKRRRDRDPPLGVETQRVVRHEAVHNVPGSIRLAVPARPRRGPDRSARPRRARSWEPHVRMGCYGLSWDYLGVKYTVPGAAPTPGYPHRIGPLTRCKLKERLKGIFRHQNPAVPCGAKGAGNVP